MGGQGFPPLINQSIRNATAILSNIDNMEWTTNSQAYYTAQILKIHIKNDAVVIGGFYFGALTTN
jgi:hypothetical protein